MSKYNYTTAMNTGALNGTGAPAGTGATYNGPIVIDSQYGKPYFYQQARNVRLAVHFTF
jgi:hypothetical protein